MSSKHSAEFKANIALEALSSSAEELDALAEKHGISKKDIQSWVKELKGKASSIFATAEDEAGHGHHHPVGEDVEIETDDEELYQYVQHGVQDDTLDYKKLIFWTSFGAAIVLTTIMALVQFSQASFFNAQQKTSINSQYPEITEQRAQQQETLNSFGVVDLENGIYRIPIDSAISNMASE